METNAKSPYYFAFARIAVFLFVFAGMWLGVGFYLLVGQVKSPDPIGVLFVGFALLAVATFLDAVAHKEIG
jgi:hypothetical protein